MGSRRIEKIDRVIRGAVSEILREVSDPRVKGLVTVTRVETSSDLHTSDVYLSVMGVSPEQEKLTLRGIEHAHPFIQAHLAGELTTKVCPTLRFHQDKSFHERMETMRILEELSASREDETGAEDEQEPPAEGKDGHEG